MKIPWLAVEITDLTPFTGLLPNYSWFSSPLCRGVSNWMVCPRSVKFSPKQMKHSFIYFFWGSKSFKIDAVVLGSYLWSCKRVYLSRTDLQISHISLKFEWRMLRGKSKTSSSKLYWTDSLLAFDSIATSLSGLLGFDFTFDFSSAEINFLLASEGISCS